MPNLMLCITVGTPFIKTRPVRSLFLKIGTIGDSAIVAVFTYFGFLSLLFLDILLKSGGSALAAIRDAARRSKPLSRKTRRHDLKLRQPHTAASGVKNARGRPRKLSAGCV
jgi:hypothetical protein